VNYSETVIDRLSSKTGLTLVLCAMLTIITPFYAKNFNVPIEFVMYVQIGFVIISIINAFGDKKHDD
jgi:uncharacterized YccA/Bax inhibitor family protein